MKKKTEIYELEILIAQAISPIIRELRLIGVADYVTYLHRNEHNQITDLIDSSAEQFFAPDFLAYRGNGKVQIQWDRPPIVELEIIINTSAFAVIFTLFLGAESASINLYDIHHKDDISPLHDLKGELKRAIRINRVDRE